MNRWSPNNNPRVRRRQLLRRKNALNHDYKTTVVVIFNLQNSHLLTLSLPTQEVFQVNGQNQPVTNFPVVDFHSQPREKLTPKPLNL